MNKDKETGQGPVKRLAFKIAEVSEMLGVSESSVRRLIENGTLRSNVKLRHILIPKTEIDRFLEV
jgi:excisionase family DNA binding protein